MEELEYGPDFDDTLEALTNLTGLNAASIRYGTPGWEIDLANKPAALLSDGGSELVNLFELIDTETNDYMVSGEKNISFTYHECTIHAKDNIINAAKELEASINEDKLPWEVQTENLPEPCTTITINIVKVLKETRFFKDWPKYNTGGGCMAYRQDMINGHLLITDSEGCDIPEPDNGYMVGLYSGPDEDQVVVNVFDKDGNLINSIGN